MNLSQDPGSPPAARLRHVLLADDDPTQCKLARLLLRREGFRVTMAHTGAEAMWHLRADRPDVVLSDVRMPEMDGLALCQFVKGDPATAAIPVVLVTSYEVEAADRERALQVGATALLIRTPSLKEALGVVAAAVEAPANARLEPAPIARPIPPPPRKAAIVPLETRQHASQVALVKGVAAIADEVVVGSNLDAALERALLGLLALEGVQCGALYVRGDEGALQRAGCHGFSSEAMPLVLSRQGAALRRVMRNRETLAIAGEATLGEDCAVVSTATGRRLILAPLICRGSSVGFLALGVDPDHASQDQWLAVTRAIGATLGQAIGLDVAQRRLVEADQRNERLRAAAAEAIRRAAGSGPPDRRRIDE